MKSEPSNHVDRNVLARQASDESDAMQIESAEPKFRPDDLHEMEVSETQDGSSESSLTNAIPVYDAQIKCNMFLCDACGFKTVQKTSFDDHLLTHVEEPSLPCDSLEYTSSSVPSAVCKIETQQNLMVCDSSVQHMNVPVKEETPSDSQVSSITVKFALSNEQLQFNDMYELSESSQLQKTELGDVGIPSTTDGPSLDTLRLKVSGEYDQEPPPRTPGPKEVSAPNKRFTCDVCGYKTNKKVTFEDHLRTHTGEKPFACDLCSYRSSSKHTLSKHKKIHTRPKPFKCDSCEYRGSTRTDLSRHMNTHAKSYTLHKGVFTPTDLVQSNVSPVIVPLQIAMNEIKSEPTSNTSPAVYTIYSTTATDDSNVAVAGSTNIGATAPDVVWQLNSGEASGGIDSTRTSEPSNDIMMLGSRTESSNDLTEGSLIQVQDGPPDKPVQMELNTGHSQDDDTSCSLEPEVVDTGSKCYSCSVCGYTNRRHHEFQVHLRTHTGETPFACDLCDKKYISKKALNRHKKKNHAEFPFSCLLCEFKTIDRMEMDKHSRSHLSINSTVNNDNNNALGEFDEDQDESAGNDPLKFDLNEEPRDGSPSWSYDMIDSDIKDEFQLKSDLEGETVFPCEFCGRKYNAKRTLDRHLRDSHGEKLFGCGLCDHKTPKKSDLIEHMKSHVKNEIGTFSSEVKRESSNDLFEMELNGVSSYSGPSESSQPGVDETHFEPSNDPLQLDLSEEHSQDSSLSLSSEADAVGGRNKRFGCDICGYKTSRKYEFTVHMRTHTGEKPYGCSLCSYRSIKRSYVNKHMKTHIKTTNSVSHEPTEPKIVLVGDTELNEMNVNSPADSTPTGRSLSGDEHFTCEHCDFKCDDITAWSQHMFEHTKERSYGCTDCDYKTNDKGSLNAHKKVCKHTQKTFETHNEPAGSVTITCEFCDYPFTTKADMSQHIMSRHPEKCPHSCEFCDFKAFNVRSLELHKETHTKPYACSVCDYRAKEESNLTRHIQMTHGRVKLFACSVCDYKVSDESLLSKHIISAHVNVQEYLCFSCDFKASNVKDVEQHIATTHNPVAGTASSFELPSNEIVSLPQPNVQQYLCYACDFKATAMAEVEEHIMRNHSAPATDELAVPLSILNPESTILNTESESYLIPPAPSDVNVQEYVCYACDYKASSVAEVQQHIQITHNPPLSESTASPMDVVSEASSSMTSL